MSACRKVFSGIHPDVITVRDEAHKNLSVDTVRQIRADAYIRPNEGARKVYIFPDCTILTEQDQNVLLKIVEEGPPYAAFLFCAENSSVVLQTLRSRCVELKLHPAVTVEKESSEAGVELCRLLAAGKRGTVTELMVRLEKNGWTGTPCGHAGSGPDPSGGSPAGPVRSIPGGTGRGPHCPTWETLDKTADHGHNRIVTNVPRSLLLQCGRQPCAGGFGGGIGGNPLTEVISVRFRGGCKNYYFDPKGHAVKMGDQVIVETAQGPEFGTCTQGNHEVADEAVVQPLCAMLRLATDADRRTVDYNRKKRARPSTSARRRSRITVWK